VFLDLWPEHIGEHIPVYIAGVTELVKLGRQTAALCVSHEVRFNTPIPTEVDIECAAAAKQIETRDLREIRMDVDEGEANRQPAPLSWGHPGQMPRTQTLPRPLVEIPYSSRLLG
jgi:hypothetical protein